MSVQLEIRVNAINLSQEPLEEDLLLPLGPPRPGHPADYGNARCAYRDEPCDKLHRPGDAPSTGWRKRPSLFLAGDSQADISSVSCSFARIKKIYQ